MTTQNTPVTTELNPAEQIHAVLGVSSEVTLSGGEKMIIKKLRVKQIRQVMEIIRPVAAQVNVKSIKEADVLALVSEHTDTVLNLVSVLSEMDKDKFEELAVDDLVTITTKVLEVNLDFFIKNVLPKFSEVLSSLTNAVTGIPTPGQTGSNS